MTSQGTQKPTKKFLRVKGPPIDWSYPALVAYLGLGYQAYD